MGTYLNNAEAVAAYKREIENSYFVDNSMLLSELFTFVGQGDCHVCITRPQGFGKTVTANMVDAFFGKGCDSHEIFDGLRIAGQKEYQKKINSHDVIHINFSEVPRNCVSYIQYIDWIEERLLKDLHEAYPAIEIETDMTLWDALCEIFEEYNGQEFVFVLDEWDYILHKEFVAKRDKVWYLSFLNNLLKNQAYVALTYMTGCEPIMEYSAWSELDMFAEFTMENSPLFGSYFERR